MTPITADDIMKCGECGELAANSRQRIKHAQEKHGTMFIEWENP